MDHSLARTLRDAVQAFASAGVHSALIGGSARNLYAPPRATRDVDFALEVASAEHFERLESALGLHGYTARTVVRSDEDDPLPDVAIFVDDDGHRIDVLVAKTPFERDALRRARPRSVLIGETVHVATLEDLIVYKLIAGRTRDVADIEEMVETQRLGGTEPDWEYVRGRGGACMAFARPAPRPPRRGVVSGTLANASHRTSCPLSWRSCRCVLRTGGVVARSRPSVSCLCPGSPKRTHTGFVGGRWHGLRP